MWACLLVSAVVVTANPPPDDRMREAIRLHDSGNYDGAIELYRKILVNRPHDPLVTYELSLSLLSKGSIADVISLCEAELKSGVMPHPKLYVVLATAYDTGGQFAKAQAALERGLKAAPEDPGIQFNLGVNLSLQEKWAAATENFLAVISKTPEHPGSWSGVARALEENNQPVRAMLAWARFATLAPSREKAEASAKQTSWLLMGRVKDEGNDKIVISVGGKGDLLEATALGAISALRFTDDWKGKTDAAFFAHALEQAVKLSRELNKNDVYWRAALEFFETAIAKGHFEAFAYEVRRLSGDAKAETWQVQNAAKVEKFRAWFSSRVNPRRP